MITHLSYHVRFRQTQRVLANSLDFGQGMTAIVGPNEAGKSFVVEMIRYAFFGSAALRGVAEDYEELRVKLIWKDYEIFRHPKGGTIKRGGEVIATGTKPLNAKVIEVLGFGLDVFDVSCVCNQGDVERLGAMTPTERKAMVDRVIGAAKIEEVQKFAAEQQSLLVREIAVLERGLVEPVEPARPAYDGPTSELRAEVARLRGLKTEHDQLVGWLSATRAAPVEPVPPTDWATEQELTEARQYEADFKRISSIPVIDFDVVELAKDWNDHVVWMQRGEFEQRHPRPFITEEGWQAHTKMNLALEQHNMLVRERDQHASRGHVTCPSCHHDFALAHKHLAELNAKIEELSAQVPEEPFDTATLRKERARLDDWAHKDTIATWELLKDVKPAPKPTISREQLALAQRSGHCSSAERAFMLARLRPTDPAADIQRLLDAQHRYKLGMEAYEAAKASHALWLAEREAKEDRLLDLSGVTGGLAQTEGWLRGVEAYERDIVAYETARDAYDARVVELGDKRADVTGWKAAREGLANIRVRIKTHLVPSLSKVASSLLNQMTDGQRSSVLVDEDFNVLVDGQRLETLSGSGKAVANLALRIALGQVLTNRVVSLFIGDEIDASMDDTRAQATHSSVRSLRGSVLQTILVSHKSVEADCVTTLGSAANASFVSVEL